MLLLPLFIISATAAVVAADTAGATTTTTNANTTIGDGDVVGCERLKQRNAFSGNDGTLQSPPNKEFWIQLRDAYVASVGKNESTIEWPLSTTTTKGSSSNSATEHLSGFRIPIEVKITPGKGRSVHTKQFVPKGAPVWNHKYTAVFHGDHSQEQFETFLTKLTWEQSCDVLQWCYAWKAGEDDAYNNTVVGCDLDEASMINHAERASGEANIEESGEANIEGLVAMKDIEAGEELVQDYNDFDEDLEWFDNLAHKAWGVDTWSQPDHPSAEGAKTTTGEL